MKPEDSPATFYEWHRRRQLRLLVTVVIFVGLILGSIVLFFVNRDASLDGPWFDRQNRVVPDGGRPDRDLVLNVWADSCQANDVFFMDLSQPVGSVARKGGDQVWLYVRYPDRLEDYQVGVRGSFLEEAPLPPDAYDTGFHRGDWRLWVSPSQIEQYIYVVNGDKAERWPRSSEPPICAD